MPAVRPPHGSARWATGSRESGGLALLRFGGYPGNCHTLLGVRNEEVSAGSRRCPSPDPTQAAVHRSSQSACPRWHPIRTGTQPQSLAWTISRRRCNKPGQQAGGAEAGGPPGFSPRRPVPSAQAGSPAALRVREPVFWIAEAGFLKDEASLLCGVPRADPNERPRFSSLVRMLPWEACRGQGLCRRRCP